MTHSIETTLYRPERHTVSLKEDLKRQLHEVRFYNDTDREVPVHTVLLYKKVPDTAYMTPFAEIEQSVLTKKQLNMIANLDCYEREDKEKLIEMFSKIHPETYKSYTPKTLFAEPDF